jgi:hypothetical protein
MESHRLLKDELELVNRALQAAAKLAPRVTDMKQHAALLMRIAAVQYAQEAYVSMLEGIQNWPAAEEFIESVKDRYDLSLDALWDTLAQSMLTLCRRMDAASLARAVSYVLALSE